MRASTSAGTVNQALVRLRVDSVDSLPFKTPDASPQLAFDNGQKVTIV